MGSLIRKLAGKAIEKAVKADPTDVFTQMNADDVVSIIKSILF